MFSYRRIFSSRPCSVPMNVTIPDVVQVSLPSKVLRLLQSGQATISTTALRLIDFSTFSNGKPANTENLLFQVVSGGPINVNSIKAPTAGGTEGSLTFEAGDFFEVDGPDMNSMQFILASGGASADVRVHAQGLV